MAQVQITHACGHAEVHYLFGRRVERDRKEQWLSGRPCPACWQAQKQAGCSAENAAAESWAAATKLPVLEGSEKQCAWAETIRRKELEGVREALSRLAGEFPEGSEGRAFVTEVTADCGRLAECGVLADWLEDGEAGELPRGLDVSARLWAESREAKLPAVLRAIAWLAGQSRASWWIDGRYSGWRELVRQRVEEPDRLERAEAERARKAEAERVRQQERQEAARREAEEKVAALARLHDSQRGWLRRLGELVGHEPSDLILIRARTNYGWRVLVNEGSDRYAREHLIDYRPAEGVLKTCRELVGKKQELLPFCIDFWALNPNAETFYSGKALFAEESEAKS